MRIVGGSASEAAFGAAARLPVRGRVDFPQFAMASDCQLPRLLHQAQVGAPALGRFRVYQAALTSPTHWQGQLRTSPHSSLPALSAIAEKPGQGHPMARAELCQMRQQFGHRNAKGLLI